MIANITKPNADWMQHKPDPINEAVNLQHRRLTAVERLAAQWEHSLECTYGKGFTAEHCDNPIGQAKMECLQELLEVIHVT